MERSSLHSTVAHEDDAAEVAPLLDYASPGAVPRKPVSRAQTIRCGGAIACSILLVAVALLRRGPAARGPEHRTGLATGSVGNSGCSARSTRDCNGRCAPTEWIADGWCDIGTDGHDLNCSLLDYDGGDCAAATLETRRLHCLDGEQLDCHGNCFPSHWLGDHDCDDPDEVDNMVYLNCAALRYDDGDCVFDEAGCTKGYVPAPCVVEPLGLPPVCVPAGWLGDGTCDYLIEDGYGLNCSETGWDGGDCSISAADDSEVLPGMQGHCGHDRIVACDGSTCIPSQLLGDQFCDECTAAMAADGYCEDDEVTSTTHFNCSELFYDGGDCLVASETGCYAGHSLDCLGQCAPLYVTAGDGICDAEYEGFVMNCSVTGWDGGDCLPPSETGGAET